MTSNAHPSIIKIEKDNLKQLTTEVKETLATSLRITSEEDKKFSVVDMWNSQRNMRTAISRRRYHTKTF